MISGIGFNTRDCLEIYLTLNRWLCIGIRQPMQGRQNGKGADFRRGPLFNLHDIQEVRGGKDFT